jgi:glycosyltransferase involved in cell wall biosynthesis
VLRPAGMLGAWSLRQRSWRKRLYLRLVEGSHLRNAAAIHATSDAEASDLETLGYGARTHMIPLGTVATARGARREDVGPLRLLFLSRLHPVKGLPLLFDALAVLPAEVGPVQLLVAGDGEAGYRRQLEALSEGAGVAGKVRFVGWVDGEQKRRLLEEADVFVLPSLHENFGVAVAEALAAGLPVIVSDQVGIAAEVEGAGAGLVVPCDAARLARAIASLAGDPALRTAMGRRAAALAAERFSWDRTAARLVELYGELVR